MFPRAALSGVMILLLQCGGETSSSDTGTAGSDAGAPDGQTTTDSSDTGVKPPACTDACDPACCTGSCVAGRCLVTLATGSVGSAIAVNATHVYWLPASVLRVPIDGGQTEELWPYGNVSASDIAAGPSGVYWATSSEYAISSSIMRLSDDDSVLPVAPCYKATSVALSSTHVYWLDGGAYKGDLHRAPLAGGELENLASNPQAWSLAVNSTDAYWVQVGAIMKLSLAGGPPTTLAQTQEYPGRLAVDASSAYWTDMSANLATGRVMKVSLAGGSPVQVATAENPGDLAVDSTSVYWTTNPAPDSGVSGSIQKLPTGGGTPETLVTGQGPVAIAIDATSVYWTNLDGTVMKLTPK